MDESFFPTREDETPMHQHHLPPPATVERIVLQAQHRQLKRLGEWTTTRHIEIDAVDSLVVADLLLPRFAPGDIEINLDLEHSTVKLLVPGGAQIDQLELLRVGRGGVKDRTGTPSLTGRRIVLTGEMRHSEVRIHRGGMALLSFLPSHQRDIRQAHRDGRLEPLVTHNGGESQ